MSDNKKEPLNAKSNFRFFLAFGLINNAKAYAATGVNYLAIGALTHSAPALDIGLDFKRGK